MERQEIAKIEANIFPPARPILRERPEFPWHRDAQSPRSSQALAVSFFNTIDRLTSRDTIVSEWIHHMGLALSSRGPWTIELEVRLPREILGEPRPTQIDALARCDGALIVFESKFMESAGGTCSQPNTIREGPHQGLRQCSGNYENQINPVNQIPSRCALTGKGIKYWELVPEVLGLDPSVDHRPCPFSRGWPYRSWFQWMRNLGAALALGRIYHVPAVFVVVYADGPFPMAHHVKSADWVHLENAAAGRSIPLCALSYQQLLRLAHEASDPADRRVLDEDLRVWMTDRIATLAAAAGASGSTVDT